MPFPPSFKTKLSRLFNAAVLGAALALAPGYATAAPSPIIENTPVQIPYDDDGTPTEDAASNISQARSAPLTAGEAALVKSIFADQLDTSVVQKYFLGYSRDIIPDTAAEVPDGRTIKFYGALNHSLDYSQEGLALYGAFLHEMTHIWQNQQNIIGHCTTYEYVLAPTYRFIDYCREQQADIIQDYARRFLHPDRRSFWIKNTPENDQLLKNIVEEQFPQARLARLAHEAQPQTTATNTSIHPQNPFTH